MTVPAGPATQKSIDDLLREQETLRAFVESISSELDLDPLLHRILRHACELIGADDGAIGLVDEALGVVRTEAIYNMPIEELGALHPPGVGMAGQVLATGEPILLDRYADLNVPSRRYHAQNAVLGFPIRWRDPMIGFIGLGAQPPLPEWGAMISRGRVFILDQWWVATMPGFAIIIVSLGFCFLGDGLRDVLDPKHGDKA